MENAKHSTNTAGARPEPEPPTPKPLAPEVAAACDIAAAPAAPPDAPSVHIAAATLRTRRVVWRRTNCGPHCRAPIIWPAWYQFGTRFGPTPDLPEAIARGTVRPGEIVAEQPHTAPGDGMARRRVRAVYLVVGGPRGPLVPCRFRRRRGGTLEIRLPDGRILSRRDPAMP